METKVNIISWSNKSTSITNKILARMRILGISPKEFRKALGYDNRVANRILSGRENLDLITITKIEEILKCQLITF